MYEPEERPSTLSRLLVPLGAVVIAVAIIAGVLFAFGVIGGSDDEDGGETVTASPTVPASPTPAAANPTEAAIGDYVRNTLQTQYAGDCSLATVGGGPPAGLTPPPGSTAAPPVDNTNRLCSLSRGEREGVQAYVLGQPLSEPTRYIFLQEVSGSWQVLESSEITAEVQAVPGIPWPLKPGAEVVVTGAAPCLNVREGPALNQAAVDCIADDTVITLASGPAEADGLKWWQVDGRAGWVAATYLRYADARQ